MSYLKSAADEHVVQVGESFALAICESVSARLVQVRLESQVCVEVVLGVASELIQETGLFEKLDGARARKWIFVAERYCGKKSLGLEH